MKKFEELSEQAKKVAIQNHHDILVENNDWFEPTVEEWKEKLEEFGYEGLNIMFNGFWSQGDGACFEYTGVDLKNEKVKAWLFSGINSEIADKIIKGVFDGEYDCDVIGKHSGHYYHENSISHYLTFNLFEDEIKICGSEDGFNKVEAQLEANAKKFQVELSKKIYMELEKDYESQTSDETIGNELIEGDYEFNEDGSGYNERSGGTWENNRILDDENQQNDKILITHLVYSYTDKWNKPVYTDIDDVDNQDYFVIDETHIAPVLKDGTCGDELSCPYEIVESDEILTSDESLTEDELKYGYSTVDNNKFGAFDDIDWVDLWEPLKNLYYDKDGFKKFSLLSDAEFEWLYNQDYIEYSKTECGLGQDWENSTFEEWVSSISANWPKNDEIKIEFDEKTTKPIDLFEPQDLIGRIINLKSDERVIYGAQIVDVYDLGNEFEITFETSSIGVVSETFKDTFVIDNEDMNFLLENGTINFNDMGTETELDLVFNGK